MDHNQQKHLQVEPRKYEQFLREKDFAENSIISYAYAVRVFMERYGAPNRTNLSAYRSYLIENYKPATVNLRILSINKYLNATGLGKLQLKFIKLPRESFLDRVISKEDYLRFKRSLRKEADQRWYFIVWFLAATGARISELTRFKVEHVRTGYVDLYSKGGRMRRLYFPETLQSEAIQWLEKEERQEGYLFLNSRGTPLTPRGISFRLKIYAKKFEIDPDLVHPHAFRHLFAKSFLQKNNNIALLADLLGHSSIETTRIYLQQSSREQGKLMNRLVDW